MATSIDMLTKNMMVKAAILCGESVWGLIRGPDGRVISREAPYAGRGTRRGGGSGGGASCKGRIGSLGVLDVATMVVTGISVGTLSIAAVGGAWLSFMIGEYVNAKEASGNSPHAKAMHGRLHLCHQLAN
jgi:hypothetical protein